jgi:transcriptional regulator with GAF, ATPase, and Fis domain
VGRFEAAHQGTLFLDEIGDIPPAIQIKLLRVLEDRRIERVGDNRSIPVDVREITATHKNLDALIEQGLFREDL